MNPEIRDCFTECRLKREKYCSDSDKTCKLGKVEGNFFQSYFFHWEQKQKAGMSLTITNLHSSPNCQPSWSTNILNIDKISFYGTGKN